MTSNIKIKIHVVTYEQQCLCVMKCTVTEQAVHRLTVHMVGSTNIISSPNTWMITKDVMAIGAHSSDTLAVLKLKDTQVVFFLNVGGLRKMNNISFYKNAK